MNKTTETANQTIVLERNQSMAAQIETGHGTATFQMNKGPLFSNSVLIDNTDNDLPSFIKKKQDKSSIIYNITEESY